MENSEQDKRTSETQYLKRTVLVTLSAGCLTFVIAGIALAVGLTLDLRMETLPRWTLILLVGSLPLSLGGVYLIVRRTLKHRQQEHDSQE